MYIEAHCLEDAGRMDDLTVPRATLGNCADEVATVADASRSVPTEGSRERASWFWIVASAVAVLVTLVWRMHR